EVFEIDEEGRLKRVFVLDDTEETHLGVVITLKVIHMPKASYLFVGGLEDTPGLSAFEIQPNGELVHVQSMPDSEAIHTDGIIGMYAFQINGQTYLFTGGFQDNGISSFQVFEDGRFKHVNSIADNTTDRYLTGAYPVDGVTLGGNHYVIVGHRHHQYYKRIEFIKRKDFVYHGDGVSVFKVNEKGELMPHHVLLNDEATKLGGQTRIEVLPLSDEEAVVTVGTRDDQSIQIARLGSDGILKPAGYLEAGYPIYYGMASLKVADDLFFFAGSVDGKVKKLYAYKTQLQDPMKAATGALRHIVNLKFKEEVTPERIDVAVDDFIKLQELIPEITDLEWGVNNSEEGHSKGFTHTFILTFTSKEALEVYLKHPDHLALVEKSGPLFADVFVMDYWVNND
ncbi:MAG: Dabb family protein, partial [Bacteroidota bacterium]